MCCDLGPLLHRSPLPQRPLLLWAQPSRLLHQGSTCFCHSVICGLVFLDVIFGNFGTSKNYLLVPLSFWILGCSNVFFPVFGYLLVVNLNNPREIPQSIIIIRNRLVLQRESKTCGNYGRIQGSWNNGNSSKAKRVTSDLWTSVWTLVAGLGSMHWSHCLLRKHPMQGTRTLVRLLPN